MNIKEVEILKSKLGKRLLIIFLSIGLIPLILFAIFTTEYLTNFLIENSEREIVKYCRISGQKLFENLSDARKSLENIPINKINNERDLKNFLQENREFSWISILRKDGKIIAESGKKNLKLLEIEKNIKKVLSLNKPVLSSPYTENLKVFPTVCLFTPYRENGKIIAGELKREFLWEITKGLYYLKNAEIAIIDSNGKILASSGNLKPYENLFSEKFIEENLKNNSGVLEVKNKIFGYYTVFLKGTFFIENWKIVIFQSQKELLSITHSFIKWFYAFILLLSSFLILLSFYNIRKLLFPLKLLTEATKHLKEGNTGYKIEIESEDEIGELISSFNEMSSKLEEKDRKLLEAKENLEKEVENRTRELKEALQKLKVTQAQVIHSEKLAAIGKLTSGIAHQINTPLTAIAGYSEAILKRIEERKEIELNILKEYLKIINEQAFGCKRTIEMLLSFSRPKQIKFDWYDLNQILKETINLLSPEAENKLVKIIYNPVNIEKVYIDGEQIKQVFLNILLNAIEAVNKNGEIKIEVIETPEKIEVSFTDNGEGINEEDLEKIFDPFWTTKKERGTGLGLSLSSEIIKGHSGEIKVKSKKGEGSTFTVVLPKFFKE